jgi:uncharacterized membrane protein
MASIHLGFKYYGIGFLAASVLTSIIAFFMLSSKLGGLEYYVFSKAFKESDNT